MDLAIESNRNSALFNTMQQVLDVYNPLLHKARPTTVNETKQRIKVSPTRWGTTLDSWTGSQSVRFDIPRIGSLTNFTVNVAFRLPGDGPSEAERQETGDRGFAKRSLTLGPGITKNQDAGDNDARGRLDRIYADDLFGLNMIKSYVVSSKSRRIFSGTGEYLMLRYSQLDVDAKRAVKQATTPKSVFNPDVDNTFYAPGTTYNAAIPLYMFFNEHITHALDVNFSEEVHIDLELRSPSQLFYYGQLADLAHVSTLAAALPASTQTYTTGGVKGEIAWDQSWSDSAWGTLSTLSPTQLNLTTETASIGLMQSTLINFIQGIAAPVSAWGSAYGAKYGLTWSGPTFAYPDVDSNGESLKAQFTGWADYLIQDTDAYRALRAQMFPEGTGLTTITYDTAQEVYQNLMSSGDPLQQGGTLLAASSGGTFIDPALSQAGLTVGDQTRFVDLNLRVNNLVMATHFMVRKHSDLGGDGNTNAGPAALEVARGLLGPVAVANVLGAHRIYTRCLPVHYFQLLSAGRVIFESDGVTQLNLTQTGMYNGTGLDQKVGYDGFSDRNITADVSSNREMNIYSINHGLQASRIENSGCLSMQNLNAPTLRIFFKPDTWGEYNLDAAGTGVSNAQKAAAQGVQVDVIHEYFNVITINSGNGEITSGLNQ